MGYIVLSGDTILDAAYNTAGSMTAIDQILEQNVDESIPMLDYNSIKDIENVPDSNRMESYTPNLVVGSELNTDNVPVQNVEAINGRPFNSTYESPLEVQTEIDDMENTLIKVYGNRIPITSIPVGYNLRGKQLVVTRTDLVVPPTLLSRIIRAFIGDNPEDPNGDIFLRHIVSNGEVLLYGNTVWEGITANTRLWQNGRWLVEEGSTFNVRDDVDCIVSLNNLVPYGSEDWGFQYMYIQPHITE